MKSNKSKMSCKQGFTRNCHAELVSASAPYRAEALNKDTFRAPLRSGFTLIELLVVVLIIGILAAVAVPQYQFAIHKTRVSRVLPLVATLRKAEQMYYLKNGSYTPWLANLDLTIMSTANGGGMIQKDFHLNMYEDRFRLSYCPHATNTATCLEENRLFTYTEYFDNTTPRKCEIVREQTLSKKLCQILLNS